MSEPPPAYEAVQNPYVPAETKQPPTNPNYPPLPTMPANYPMPPQHAGVHHAPPQTIIVGSIVFNQNPASLTCPHCHKLIVTKAVPKTGLFTYLLCCGMAVFGCWLCCCMPFCFDSCKDTEHFCPNCRKLLGTYRRL